MGPRTLSRRERLRAETTAEIKSVALGLITACGPDAISLRAIAREMGMTANAIYSYFATRDDLVSALIDDLYTSLVDTLESARDGQPDDDPARRLLAWAQAFRSWSLTNPCGFRLIYGDPVPGYRAPEGGPAPGSHRRTLAGLTELVAAAERADAPRPSGPGNGTDTGDIYDWSDFDGDLVATVRQQGAELRPEHVALALRTWARMHGLVAFEVYGHLGAKPTVADQLYHADMSGLLRSLGLTPPA